MKPYFSLLVCSALLGASGAQAQVADEPVDDAPTNPDGTEGSEAPTGGNRYAHVDAEDAELDVEEDPRVKMHSAGIGFHSVLIRSERADRYVLSGPSVVYDYSVGRRWAFGLRGIAYFPATGRMSGTSSPYQGNIFQDYSLRHFGFDGMFMLDRRFEISPKLVVSAGVGLHVQSFALQSAILLPVEAITMGVGSRARVDYRIGDWLTVGGTAAMGLDGLDLIKHTNRAVMVVPFSITANVGARF